MDIAELGFRVQTDALDTAVTKLNNLKTAAAGVSAAEAKMAAAANAASGKITAAKTAIARADAAEASAALKRVKANASASQQEKDAAITLQKKTALALADANAEEKRATALMKSAAAQKSSNNVNKVAFAGGSTSTMMGKMSAAGPSLAVNNGRTIARDAAPNKFNTANIAAQFQDIGVTAAMGMNPLQIALQQGTQLAAILNSMESPVKGLGEAFKQVFNAVSLGTIAIIAIIAALLQFVNWIKVAQTVLNGLADVIQKTLPYVVGLGVVLTLIYSPVIIAGIASLTVTITTLGIAALDAAAEIATAWLIAMGPIGWVIAGIAVVTAAFQAFGFDAIGYVKNAINIIIGSFVGAFNTIKTLWSTLPGVMGDIVISTANLVLGKLSGMINSFVQMINDLIDKIPEDLRPSGGKITWKAEIKLDNPFAGQAAEAGKVAGDEFAKAFKVNYVDKAIDATQRAADAAARGIRNYASHLGDKKEKGKSAEDLYDEVLRGADRRIASLKAERDSIGLSEFATDKLKFETELLNDAQQKNIDLTAAGKAELMGRANDMAVLSEQTRRTKESYDLLKDSAKGFLQDMKQGLSEGKSLWESFGNAVTNVLNKILDKMLDMEVNAAFSGGPGGASLFSSIFSGSGGAPSGNTVGPTQGSNSLLSSFGFAKGGAFTNSIVNRATPFTFASGGAFGVMGEAGPEAVMPLHRGPDGSLGVRMAGGGNGGGNVTVNIMNYGDSKVSTQQRQTSGGVEIDVMIDEIISQKVSDQSSATNRSLNSRDSRRLISR